MADIRVLEADDDATAIDRAREAAEAWPEADTVSVFFGERPVSVITTWREPTRRAA